MRTFLFVLMFAAAGAWFAYDGMVGYPTKNFQEHLDFLELADREKARNAQINPHVTRDKSPAARDLCKLRSLDEQRRAFETLYNGPPSYETDEEWHYFGPYYHVKLRIKDGRVRKVIPNSLAKSETDIRLQKIIGLVLGFLSVGALLFFIKVARTKLALDENGLAYNGKPGIAWANMNSMDARRFRQKGWVDLIYDDDGAKRRLRLDEYHLAKFADVIAELCDRKGFENPIELDKASKQAPPAD